MLSRANKEKVIDDFKTNIEKSKALFLTNLVGISSNDAVAIRHAVRDVGGKIIITRNTLFRKGSEGTYAEKLLSDLKGTNAVALAFDDAASVAKVLKEAAKNQELIELRSGYLDKKELNAKEVSFLASLPSKPEMLATLLATFMAPASAFARLLHAVKEQKEGGATQI